MPYIYKITNQINQKVYIGKTIRTVQERWKEHCKSYEGHKNESRPLYRAMLKYGIENFICETIEECSTEILEDRERYWIETYNSFKNGYNATLGGDGTPYIDRQLVIKAYEKLGQCNEVAKLMCIDVGTVSKILQEQQIAVRTSSEINLSKFGCTVAMKQLNGKIIQIFPSIQEAARYVITEKLSNDKSLKSIAGHIGQVCNGKRQTAYNHKWEKI